MGKKQTKQSRKTAKRKERQRAERLELARAARRRGGFYPSRPPAIPFDAGMGMAAAAAALLGRATLRRR